MKLDNPYKKLRNIVATVAMVGALGFTVGCASTIEHAGDHIEHATNKVGNKIKSVGHKIENATDG